jgi:LysM repeat protein
VDDAALDEALRAVRAGASVHALFRSNEDASHASQRLIVFVVEVANESAARKLLELSQKKKTQDHDILGITEGRLFCLVVAGSFAMGVESYETPATLPRFSAGLTEILRRAVKNH